MPRCIIQLLRGLLIGVSIGLTFSAADLAAAAGPELPDPYFVFYPGNDCPTGILEVEVFDRKRSDWQPHPTHRRILADSCQREDAGGLLNEVRARCHDPGRIHWDRQWRVGFSLEQLRDEANCRPPPVKELDEPSARIELATPREGAPIRNLSQRAHFAGRIDLAHDLVVLIDGALNPVSARSLSQGLTAWLSELSPLLGPLRIAWVPFRSAPASSSTPGHERAEAPIRVAPLGASAPQLREQLAVALDRESSRAVPGLAAALRTANRTLAGGARAGKRRTVVVFADSRAEFPLGGAAGAAPRFRRRVLEEIEATLAAEGRSHFVLIGRGEIELGELVDRIREKLGDREQRGSIRVLEHARGAEGAASIRAALSQIEVVSLRELHVVNVSNGILAEGVRFGPDGGFEGELGLRAGENRIRVEAVLSGGRELARDFDRSFDDSLIRERILDAERERIRRSRAQRGVLTIEAEER